MKNSSDSQIVRPIKVATNRTSEEALKATGRFQFVNDSVVTDMPRAEVETVEVVFFQPHHVMTEEELAEAFEELGLEAVDPITLAAVNEADPSFADEHTNATHWKNGDNEWDFILFNMVGGERRLHVHHRSKDISWLPSCWFAGFRK